MGMKFFSPGDKVIMCYSKQCTGSVFKFRIRKVIEDVGIKVKYYIPKEDIVLGIQIEGEYFRPKKMILPYTEINMIALALSPCIETMNELRDGKNYSHSDDTSGNVG